MNGIYLLADNNNHSKSNKVKGDFFYKTCFNISFKLFSKETICKNKKSISNCRLLKCLPIVLCVNERTFRTKTLTVFFSNQMDFHLVTMI